MNFESIKGAVAQASWPAEFPKASFEVIDGAIKSITLEAPSGQTFRIGHSPYSGGLEFGQKAPEKRWRVAGGGLQTGGFVTEDAAQEALLATARLLDIPHQVLKVEEYTL